MTRLPCPVTIAGMDALLSRPGLDPGVRALLLMQVAIARGSWEDAEKWMRAARDLEVRRPAIEEALLQGVLFCGFPRAVSAFECLQEVWPPPATPQGGGLPPEAHESAGRELFAKVYGSAAPQVLARLRAYHGEFHDFVLQAAYGRILARPGLSLLVRELLAVAALVALGHQVPQLVAHGRGAVRAGASPVELREALFTALRDEEAAAAILRRIEGVGP